MCASRQIERRLSPAANLVQISAAAASEYFDGLPRFFCTLMATSTLEVLAFYSAAEPARMANSSPSRLSEARLGRDDRETALGDCTPAEPENRVAVETEHFGSAAN